jgi:hypothetical protein
MPKISKEELLNSYKAGERNFRGAQLEEAVNLEGVTLYEVNLSYASLHRANLSQANLHGAQLNGTVLIEAVLCGANLSKAELYRAYLGEANLQGANLSGANLQGADLQGAYLEKALYDEQTQFPPNFDPEGKGLLSTHEVISVWDLRLNNMPIIWLLLREINCLAGILYLRKVLSPHETSPPTNGNGKNNQNKVIYIVLIVFAVISGGILFIRNMAIPDNNYIKAMETAQQALDKFECSKDSQNLGVIYDDMQEAIAQLDEAKAKEEASRFRNNLTTIESCLNYQRAYRDFEQAADVQALQDAYARMESAIARLKEIPDDTEAAVKAKKALSELGFQRRALAARIAQEKKLSHQLSLVDEVAQRAIAMTRIIPPDTSLANEKQIQEVREQFNRAFKTFHHSFKLLQDIETTNDTPIAAQTKNANLGNYCNEYDKLIERVREHCDRFIAPGFECDLLPDSSPATCS